MEAELTTQVLREIRDSINTLRDEVRADIARLDVKIDQTRLDLGRRIDQTNRQLLAVEARLSTEISALHAR